MTKEDYGIDAPTVVRNFLLIGLTLLVLGGGTLLAISEGWLGAATPVRILVDAMPTGVICLVMAGWMTLSSRVLKMKVCRAMLDSRAWRGDETMLDIGCGRGLVAIAAARRLPRGHVTGVDLWQEKDLGGNSPEAIRANAEAAGVAGRLTIDTGDARALPYADGAFDVVASMTAIHNIPDHEGRMRAIVEAWRVTKAGGDILIFDIRHGRKYAKRLRELGAADVRLTGPILLWGPIGWRFIATKPG